MPLLTCTLNVEYRAQLLFKFLTYWMKSISFSIAMIIGFGNPLLLWAGFQIICCQSEVSQLLVGCSHTGLVEGCQYLKHMIQIYSIALMWLFGVSSKQVGIAARSLEVDQNWTCPIAHMSSILWRTLLGTRKLGVGWEILPAACKVVAS